MPFWCFSFIRVQSAFNFRVGKMENGGITEDENETARLRTSSTRMTRSFAMATPQLSRHMNRPTQLSLYRKNCSDTVLFGKQFEIATG